MKKSRIVLLLVLLVILTGYLLPERIVIPVAQATPADWNRQSFWYEPWGASGVHKGIDIFGRIGTDVVSTTDGIVLFAGHLSRGGNVVLVLGPRWRLHYFAHLNSIGASALHPVAAGETIGTLGDSGNAKGKPPHLH
ncbi:MAG: M23 family metallopeptidase, partial [Candidatus Thiodiazotropha sp.]